MQLAVQKVPGGLSVSLRKIRRAVVDQNRKRRLGLSQIASKRAAFLQQLGHVVDVDNRHHQFRIEDWHVFLAGVHFDEFIDRRAELRRGLSGSCVVRPQKESRK